MSIPFSVDSKRATTNIVVQLSPSQVPPTLPFELKDHVSPNTWEIRVSTLTRLASRYCRPTLERAYLIIILVLTFLVPITTYYVLESTAHEADNQIWLARFSCVAVTIAVWIVFSLPMVVWKYLGKVRVLKLVDQWTRSDALSAPSYGTAPVWTACAPGLFRDTIVLMVAVPFTKKSHFDHDSCLPPYVSAGDVALPSYGDSNSNMVRWSKDLKGGIRYGELPIYANDKLTVV